MILHYCSLLKDYIREHLCFARGMIYRCTSLLYLYCCLNKTDLCEKSQAEPAIRNVIALKNAVRSHTNLACGRFWEQHCVWFRALTCIKAQSMSIAACVTPSSFLFSALTTFTPSLSLNLMCKEYRRINFQYEQFLFMYQVHWS